MATFVTESIIEAGLNATYNVAAAGGDDFVNDGSDRQFLHVKNAHASVSRVVTLVPDETSTTKTGFGALTRASIVVTVPGPGERYIGPFPKTAFASPVITYDDEADLTLALLKI